MSVPALSDPPASAASELTELVLMLEGIEEKIGWHLPHQVVAVPVDRPRVLVRITNEHDHPYDDLVGVTLPDELSTLVVIAEGRQRHPDGHPGRVRTAFAANRAGEEVSVLRFRGEIAQVATERPQGRIPWAVRRCLGLPSGAVAPPLEHYAGRMWLQGLIRRLADGEEVDQRAVEEDDPLLLLEKGLTWANVVAACRNAVEPLPHVGPEEARWMDDAMLADHLHHVYLPPAEALVHIREMAGAHIAGPLGNELRRRRWWG